VLLLVQSSNLPRISMNLRRRYSVATISRKETQMTSAESFGQAIEANHRALDQVASGDPSGFFELFSDSEEATLANPFGPPARGRTQIEEAGQRAASNYREGRVVEFESFAKVETDEFGYTVEIERFEAKVGGSDEMTPVALRVTCIFRAEDGTWKLVHRHADPITTIQPAESVVGS
jgi:ketosteroid isomerase-like protein